MTRRTDADATGRMEPIRPRSRPTGMRFFCALTAVLLLAGCAERGAADGPDAEAEPRPPATGLVLRVDYTGGFTTPTANVARLPLVSVYADGAMITEGPVVAVYPGPALPNLQVTRLDPAAVQDLVGRALDAGVADPGDLGSPPLADAFSTRFTLVTSEGTYQREVYALGDAPEGSGLSADQEEARHRLADLLASVADPGGRDSTAYAAQSMAAVVTPWVDPQDGLAQPEVPWPGPALPGESTGGPADVGCVTATGAQADAVVQAAQGANAATPWVTGDGSRWTVVLRPLLPDETGCADLTR